MDLDLETQSKVEVLYSDRGESIVQSFANTDVLTSEFLITPTHTTARKINKSASELQWFIDSYKSELKSNLLNFRTIDSFDEHKNDQYCFTTGDENLDNILNGGIPTGYLIEISGAAGCGKTNLLMNLAVTAQLPKDFGGLGASVFDETKSTDGKFRPIKSMYIPTETMVPTPRLESITNHYKNLLIENGITEKRFHPNIENVVTTSMVIPDLEYQEHMIHYQLPVMLDKNPDIKLVILDSITHHVRSEISTWDRDLYTAKICKFLKNLAMKNNITILFANQVTDSPLRGIYFAKNETLIKLNMDYQTSWLSGWDDVAVVYRQLKAKKRKNQELDDFDDYGEIGYADSNNTAYEEGSVAKNGSGVSSKELYYTSGADEHRDLSLESSLRNFIKKGKKKLFESRYRTKVSKTKTIPALGHTLLNFIDMRIVLSRELKPILNENLINEFSEDLGIDTSALSDTPSQEIKADGTEGGEDEPYDEGEGNTDSKGLTNARTPSIEEVLRSNEYLTNRNFETQRLMRVVFTPLLPDGQSRESTFEIWNGGIRHT